MRLFSAGICTTVAVTLLAGCSGNMSQTTPLGSNSISQSDVKSMIHHHQRPVWRDPANLMNNDAAKPYFRSTLARLTPVKKATGSLSKGMYVNQFYGNLIYAYQNRNTANNPPACTISTGGSPYSYVNGINVDYNGNLIAPIGFNYSGQHAVEVFQGPGMCGAEAGSFLDQYGQPSNAFATDAINGNILIGNIFDNSNGPGSLSICSIASACTVNLTNAAIYKLAGVAMNSAGDCWASAENYSGVATLTWFQGCTGAGQQATGFMNTDYGALTWDKSGNMVSVDKTGLQVWVYSGCNPACTVVAGPYPLVNECVSGALNKQTMTFMCGAPLAGEVDVYAYTPTSLTFMYSYNNGLSVTGTVEGVAYNPAVHAP